MSTTTTTVGHCEVHVRCASKLLNVHHSPPKSWNPTSTVKHALCPNAHEGEVHVGIDEIVHHGKLVSRFSPKVRAIIYEAFDLARAQSLTPRTTL